MSVIVTLHFHHSIMNDTLGRLEYGLSFERSATMALSGYVYYLLRATDLMIIGVSLFFAVRGITSDLRRVSDLTEIKHVEKEDKMISEGTEDGWWISPYCDLPC
jgi:hypothetical protein